MQRSFGSTCHGAGRALSRSAAMRGLDSKQVSWLHSCGHHDGHVCTHASMISDSQIAAALIGSKLALQHQPCTCWQLVVYRQDMYS
jgi:hypothetical protein